MNRRARAIALAVVAPLVLVVAAVLAFGGGGGGTPRKLPIAAGDAAGESKALADAVPSGVAYGGVRYEAGPDLPALDGKAHAYKVLGAVDAAAARRVADAFGLAGEVVEDNGSFTVEGDGHRVFVYAGAGGQFSYQGTTPTASSVPLCSPVPPGAEAFAADTGGGTGSGAGTASVDPTGGKPAEGFCAPPTTTIPVHPAGFPTEAAARETALKALAAAGVATSDAKVEAYDDGYQWQVTVTPRVDGLLAQGLQASASVNEVGIAYAYGSLGHAEKVDEYPLIGTAKAIVQLNDGTALFGFGGYRTAYAADGVATTATASASGEIPPYPAPDPADPSAGPGEPATVCAVAPSADGTATGCATPGSEIAPAYPVPPVCTTIASQDGSTGESCSGSAGSGAGIGDPGVACPAIAAVPPATVPPCPPDTTVPDGPPPEPQVVTLTGAELGLMLAPSGATDSYLLPAYLFTTADGPGPTTLAIDTSWLEPPTPPETVVPDTASGTVEVPCSTPGATGPCTVGPIETAPAPGGGAPPTTCGPPVQSQAPDAPAAPANEVGCPIN